MHMEDIRFIVTAIVILVPSALAFLLTPFINRGRKPHTATIRIPKRDAIGGLALTAAAVFFFLLFRAAAAADALLGNILCLLLLLLATAFIWGRLVFRIDLAEEEMYYRSFFGKTHTIRYENIVAMRRLATGGVLLETRNPYKVFYPWYACDWDELRELLQKSQEERNFPTFSC